MELHEVSPNSSNVNSCCAEREAAVYHFSPDISVNLHWLWTMMHRYSCVMFWVILKPFLPSEVRGCNLSNVCEQKAMIKAPSSHLRANLHNRYSFWKGSGKELQLSRTNKHKRKRSWCSEYSISCIKSLLSDVTNTHGLGAHVPFLSKRTELWRPDYRCGLQCNCQPE